MTAHKLLTTAFAALVCSSVASADVIVLNLSTDSSDATPASVLSAAFKFNANGANMLKLTVTNNTVAPSEFNINMIYFNFDAPVTGVSITPPTGWSLVTNVMVDGFGVFDVGMENGVGETDPDVINPAGSLVFNFTFTGSGTAAAFADAVSSTGFFIAAKFVNGPDDPEDPGNEDSAFGALIPLPMAFPMGLAGLGGVVLIGRRRAMQLRRAA